MPFACSAGCHFWYKYADIHSDNYFLVSRCPFSLRQKRPALQEISIWKPHGHCDRHKINITIQFTYLCFTMRPTPLHYVKAWSKNTRNDTFALFGLIGQSTIWKYITSVMLSTTDVFWKVQKRSHWKDIWSKTRISLGEIFWRWMIWVSGRLNLIQQQILAISSKSDCGIIQHSLPDDINPASKADKPTELNWIYYAL